MWNARGATGADPSCESFGRLIAWFGTVWVCTAAALWCAVRFHILGSGSLDLPALLRAVGFGLALVFALTLRGWLAVAGVGALVSALAVARYSGGAADALVGLACFGLGVLRLGGVAWRPVAVVAVAGVLVALRHMSALVGFGYALPVSQELALVGMQHKDTLFHAAIAELFQTTGAVSIGLNGLEPLRYHALSHLFLAEFGRWLGRPMLEAYGLFVPVVGGAALFVAFLAALRAVVGRGARQGAAVALVLAVSIAALSDRLMPSFWISESYLVSLFLMFLAVAVMAGSGGAGVGTVASLALLVGLTSFAKISTGAVLICGLVPMLLLAGRWRLRAFGAAAAVCLPFAAVYVLTFSASEAGGGMIAPFAYYRAGGAELGLATLLVAGFASVSTWRRHRSDPGLVGSCLMAWAGLAAGALLDLAAGATGYFVGPGLWAALMAVLARVTCRDAPLSMRTVPVALVLLCLHALGGLGGRAADRLADYARALQGPVPEEAVQRGVYARIAKAVADRPTIEAVHVDPAVATFWTGGAKVCWAPSLTVQALTGRPVLGGIVPAEYDCLSPAPYYGWADYDPATDTARALSPEGICAAAAPWGFAEVLEVGADRSLSVVTCEQGKAGAVLRVSDGDLP